MPLAYSFRKLLFLLSICLFAFVTRSDDDLSYGSILQITAEDVGINTFTGKPTVSVTYDDPVSGKVGRKTNLNVIAVQNDSVTVELNKRIPLFSRRAYRGVKKSQKLLDSPVQDLTFTSLQAKNGGIGPSPVNVNKTVHEKNPVVTDATGSYALEGDQFTIIGNYFGTKAPKVYIEYYYLSKWRYAPCKVINELTYIFKNAKGKANKSCMKVLPGDDVYDPAKTVGYSEVTLQFPKIPIRAEQSGYIIVNNKVGLTAFALPTQFNAAMLDGFEKAVDFTLADRLVPGVIAAIFLEAQGGTWIRQKGFNDVDLLKFMRYSNRARIGDLTKSFTSTILLQLVDEGKLSLDDTLDKFTFEVPIPNADKITVRQLCNMTSGLYPYTQDDVFITRVAYIPTRSWRPRALMKFSFAHSPLFEPGTDWGYSSTNYIILGLIIEQLTGKSLKDELKDRISSVLDITTARLPHGYKAGANFVQGYHYEDEEYINVTQTSASAYWAAGGMVAKMQDLKVAVETFVKGDLLSDATQKERLTWVDTGRDDGLQYGLGLMKYGGFIGHSGSIYGYSTAMYHWPEKGATIVVILNSDTILTDGTWVGTELFQNLAEQLYPDETFPWENNKQ